MIRYSKDEAISVEEYVGFLKRTDLGSQYPRERFEERIARTLRNRSVSISARTETGLLIGVCFGLTDFAYFLFITDLGVDRDYERAGIGRTMIKMIQAAAGGEEDITVVLVANADATGFYEKVGYTSEPNVLWWKPCRAWTPWTIE